MYDDQRRFNGMLGGKISNGIKWVPVINVFLFSYKNEGSERRRYNWLKLKNGTALGHDLMCLNAEKKDAVSWTYWFYKCNTCLCYCDEPGSDSERYFSLRAVESNIQANK